MLKTDFLGLNYHPNPATNTDEVDAEKYFNENYFTIDANAKSVNEQLNKQISKVEQLQTENNELSNNMPWNATSGKSLHITDSAKYSKNRLSLSGDMEQENLLKIDNGTVTSKGITSTVNNGSLNISGTTTANWFDVTSGSNKIKINLKGNIEYILDINKTLPSTIVLVARFYNEDSENVVQSVQIKNGSTRATFTLSKDIERCYFTTINCITGDTISITDLKIKIFLTQIKTCIGVQKIKQFGKNWFNKNNISKINAVVDTSSITANSSAKSFYIKIEPDTYTVSRKVIGTRFVAGTTANIPKIGETIIDRIVNNSGSSITLTTSKNANYLVVYYLYNSSENEQEILDSIQIERGPKATKCKSYIEEINTLDLKNTELCAIKDTNGNVVAQDRALYRNGKWQWEKKIKKLVLTGKESWNKSNTTTVAYYARNLINDVDTSTISLWGGDVVANAISNYFTMVSPAKIFANIEACCLNGPGDLVVRLGFGLNTDITTVALLQKWLAQKYTEGNPVVIYYILATPEYTDCTAEQSAVLDKLYNNFKLSKGTNNIIVESENGVGLELDLSYMQDINIKDKKLEERVTTLENLLSTTQTSAMLLDNLETDLESEV